MNHLFSNLYAAIDVFSRKIVGWEVHAVENGELAAALTEQGRWRERRWGKPMMLYAHNNAPQRSLTLYARPIERGHMLRTAVHRGIRPLLLVLFAV